MKLLITNYEGFMRLQNVMFNKQSDWLYSGIVSICANQDGGAVRGAIPEKIPIPVPIPGFIMYL